MSLRTRWIAACILLLIVELLLPVRVYAQERQFGGSIPARVVSVVEDAFAGSVMFRVKGKLPLPVPVIQYFPGEGGKTTMSVDFPGLVWNQPSTILHPAIEHVDLIRIGQFQSDPPVFRISITTSNPALLRKIDLRANGDSLIVKFPNQSHPKPLYLDSRSNSYATGESGRAIDRTADRVAERTTGERILKAKSANGPGSLGRSADVEPSSGRELSQFMPQRLPQTSSRSLRNLRSTPSTGVPQGEQERCAQVPADVPGLRPALPEDFTGESMQSAKRDERASLTERGSGKAEPAGAIPPSSRSTAAPAALSARSLAAPPLVSPVKEASTSREEPPLARSRWARFSSVFPPLAPSFLRKHARRVEPSSDSASSSGTVGKLPQPTEDSATPGSPDLKNSKTAARGNSQNEFSRSGRRSGEKTATEGTRADNARGMNDPGTPVTQVTKKGQTTGSVASAEGPAMRLSNVAQRAEALRGGQPGGEMSPPVAPDYRQWSAPNAPKLQDVRVSNQKPEKRRFSRSEAGEDPVAVPNNMSDSPDRENGVATAEPLQYVLPSITFVGTQPLQLTVKGSGHIKYKSFHLSDPERYVVDFVEGAPSVESVIPQSPCRELLTGLRTGKPDSENGDVRLVLDLARAGLTVKEELVSEESGLVLTIVEREMALTPGIATVVLDPGHGGSDPGAQRGDLREKDMTMGITLKLKKELEKQGLRIILTRSDDTFVSLEDRVRITNEVKPDAFVSVHINSLESDSEICGIETYYQNDCSKVLAQKIHQALVGQLEVPDRSVRKARFYVVNHTPHPAILAEVGFISNKKEREKLMSGEYQGRVAEALSQGIIIYLSEARNVARRHEDERKASEPSVARRAAGSGATGMVRNIFTR